MFQIFSNNHRPKSFSKHSLTSLLALSSILFASSCVQVTAPEARNVNIPPPKTAQERQKALNERPDAVMYIPLGIDVLLPEAPLSDPFPHKFVGPFELRGETLGGALQLVLDGIDIPIAFEDTDGIDNKITITNLKGDLETVVTRLCSLADLYCAYEDGMLVVKETQIFTVTIPPVSDSDTFLSNVSAALGEIIGSTPVTDASTRTIVYRASHRTSEIAESYLQRLRSNTALIIFETYIWEVSLDSGNSTGISWDSIESLGKFTSDISITGVANPSLGTPISIGLPTDGILSGDKVFQFISQYGSVKTISQPQVTVLSGSAARFRVADTQNYVSEITRSVDEGVESISTTTSSVDTGFTFDISSNWDKATVYGNIEILLQEVRSIDTFDENPDAIVQLPQTTERELSTQVRIRPGDSLLIAGLVREIDNFSKDGPGFQSPLFPTSRTAQTSNVELVFLLRPRVIVYTSPTKEDFDNIKAKSIQASNITKDMTGDPIESPLYREDIEEKTVTNVQINKPEYERPSVIISPLEENEENTDSSAYKPLPPVF